MTRQDKIKGLMNYIITFDKIYNSTGDIRHKQEVLEALELLNILLKSDKPKKTKAKKKVADK